MCPQSLYSEVARIRDTGPAIIASGDGSASRLAQADYNEGMAGLWCHARTGRWLILAP